MCNVRLRTGVSSIGLAVAAAVPTMAMAVATLAGCSVDVWSGLPHSSGNGPGDTDEAVTIRFVNLTTDEAVDVEFYVANEPLEAVPDDLFVEENRVTASIGVAGLGIVQPGAADSIELPCSEDLTIGTRGGTFLDNESGEDRGVGIMRWVQEGQVALCGAIVSFTFARDGEAFTTKLIVGE